MNLPGPWGGKIRLVRTRSTGTLSCRANPPSRIGRRRLVSQVPYTTRFATRRSLLRRGMAAVPDTAVEKRSILNTLWSRRGQRTSPARLRGTPAAPRESCLGENRSLSSVEVDTLMFLVDRSEEHRDHPINIVRRAGDRSGAAEDPGGR